MTGAATTSACSLGSRRGSRGRRRSPAIGAPARAREVERERARASRRRRASFFPPSRLSLGARAHRKHVDPHDAVTSRARARRHHEAAPRRAPAVRHEHRRRARVRRDLVQLRVPAPAARRGRRLDDVALHAPRLPVPAIVREREGEQPSDAHAEPAKPLAVRARELLMMEPASSDSAAFLAASRARSRRRPRRAACRRGSRSATAAGRWTSTRGTSRARPRTAARRGARRRRSARRWRGRTDSGRGWCRSRTAPAPSSRPSA